MSTIPNNLPLQLSSFIGREREMAEVKRLLSTSRLVTLTGVGGCGKTRLAIEVARSADLSRYSDGVWLIELAALADPGLVAQTVAKAVGVAEQPGRPLTETLVDFLRARQLLLVLDNCEHVIEETAQLTVLLLQACPHLHILATSREVLNMNGELAWIVPPLAIPSHPLPPADLEQFDAIRLFVERASAVLPGFKLTAQNAAAVAQICQRLDGIPLAIELAAARVKMLSAEQIATHLDDVFHLLTAGKRMAPQRHQTLRATMDWSYNLLSPPEQTLFRRLAVFAGGWTLEAVEAVCAGEDIGQGEVLNLLSHLIDKSLVVERELGQAARYGLLEAVRQYGLEWLLESGEMDTIRQQHANFFLRLAEAVEPKLIGPEQGVWLERLKTEHDNLRAALHWMAENEPLEMGLRLGGALWWFWSGHGHLSEGQRWLEQALATGQQASAPLRAKALLGAGYLAGLQNDYARATALSEESLTLYRELRDKHGVALALTNLSKMALDQANYGQATIYLEEGLALFQELGDRWGIVTSLSGLGNVAYHQDDYARASTLYEESLALARKMADTRGITVALIYLSEIALAESDYARATMLLEESLALGRELGDKELIAGTWEGLARVAGAQGQPERSARLFGAAEALFEAIGLPLSPAYRAEYERKVAAVRAQLDEAAFNTAWAEGRAMPLEQAIIYALAEPPALLETRTEPAPPTTQAKHRLFGLTKREREIAVLIARGLSNRAIAAHLVVTERTVETHVGNILSKLGFTSRSQIAAWAVEKGLTQDGE